MIVIINLPFYHYKSLLLLKTGKWMTRLTMDKIILDCLRANLCLGKILSREEVQQQSLIWRRQNIFEFRKWNQRGKEIFVSRLDQDVNNLLVLPGGLKPYHLRRSPTWAVLMSSGKSLFTKSFVPKAICARFSCSSRRSLWKACSSTWICLKRRWIECFHALMDSLVKSPLG